MRNQHLDNIGSSLKATTEGPRTDRTWSEDSEGRVMRGLWAIVLLTSLSGCFLPSKYRVTLEPHVVDNEPINGTAELLIFVVPHYSGGVDYESQIGRAHV